MIVKRQWQKRSMLSTDEWVERVKQAPDLEGIAQVLLEWLACLNTTPNP